MTLSAKTLNVLFGSANSEVRDGSRALLSPRRFQHDVDSIEFADTPVREEAKSHRMLTAWEIWHLLDENQLVTLARNGRVKLDEAKAKIRRSISEGPDDLEDHALGVRLRELQHTAGSSRLTEQAVLKLSMAAWVALRQKILREWLGLTARQSAIADIEPDGFYGDPTCPVWECGYRLARHTREALGLGPEQPVEALRTLIEERLHIPVIQSDLPPRIAGATVANNDARGIVVNTQGNNRNVWVLRSTLAHELGHLLWDPAERLNHLIVDHHELLQASAEDTTLDPVEKRANAFAIEFLAPGDAILAIDSKCNDRPADAIREITRRYGVSFTAANNHLWNARRRVGRVLYDKDQIRAERSHSPGQDWKARESFTVDYFPIASVPAERRGPFAGLVVAGLENGLISRSTAAENLQVEAHELTTRSVSAIASIYPRIVAEARQRMGEMRASLRPMRQRSDVRANHVWLVRHAKDHQGSWVAVRGGKLVADASTYDGLAGCIQAKGLKATDVFIADLRLQNAIA